MTFQILMSCMHQHDNSIFDKSNVKCDILCVNQCDKDSIEYNHKRNQIMINTTERGLSRSRNMCIKRAWADICLLSDDDEFFYNNTEEQITKAYEYYNTADVIAFKVDNASGFADNVDDKKKYPQEAFQCSFLQTLHISSWQISFRRQAIREHGIHFDESMGSGTGNGGQEESKFLVDCYKAGLKIWYVPISIARMYDSHSSQWFKGFDNTFFYNRGWATRRFLGWTLSTIYALYFAIKKYKIYSNDISFFNALFMMLKGINSPKERTSESIL